MIIPYRINNYPAANPCDFSDSIKQKDFFFSQSLTFSLCMTNTGKKHSQMQDGGQGKEGMWSDKQIRTVPGPKQCPGQQLSRTGGGSVTLWKSCQSQLTASWPCIKMWVLWVLRCVPALTPHTDLRLLAVHLFWRCHCIQWLTPVFVTCTLDSRKRQPSPVCEKSWQISAELKEEVESERLKSLPFLFPPLLPLTSRWIKTYLRPCCNQVTSVTFWIGQHREQQPYD